MVLVTGGTGAVGRHVVRRLATEGYRVRVYARHAAENAPPGVQAVAGDVQDLAALERATSDVQAVVHVVGILREQRGQTFEGVHIRGTRNAVTAAERAGARRFIYVGGVQADPDSADPLSSSKGLAEREVRRSGLDYTILRSSMVFGVSPGVLDRIAWSLDVSRPLVLLPCGGRGLFQPLWVEDLSTCVSGCLREGRGAGRTFELGGPETWSYRDMVRMLLRGSHIRRVLVPVPFWLMAALAMAPRLVGREPFATRTELRQLCLDNRTDPTVLPREFGISPARLEEKM